MDCENPFDRLRKRLNELKEDIDNLQIVFGLTKEQIELLLISLDEFGNSLPIEDLREYALGLFEYEVECIREPVERDPYPPYREKLHPRKDWQQKQYWLRTRSNPKKKGYH